jgi:hypothetical protein
MTTLDCFVVFGPMLALVAVMFVCFGLAHFFENRC